MSGMVLGISKKTFLKQHVVPSSPYDKFNDDICAFCLCEYNDSDHLAVRVLPCNHVFGRPCLLIMIGGHQGHLCSLCAAPLFGPSAVVTFDDIVLGIVQKIEAVSLQVSYLFDPLPTPVNTFLRFLWYRHCLLYYAELVVDRCTNVGVRNPALNLRRLTLVMTLLRLCVSFKYSLALSIAMVVVALLFGAHGEFSNLKDRIMFFGIMLVAILLWSVVYVCCEAMSNYLLGLL
ncbi:Ring finger domain containing protein [Pyrenophora tritici-repentis]|nr:Ring finger domain containing protein [Pyrenophora tritici-repentis]